MKNILALLLVTLFVGCSEDNTNKELFGNYESPGFNLFRAVKQYSKGQRSINNSELILKKDSTFEETTCGNILTGYWKVKYDSLYLFAETNRWRDDSLHKYGYEGKQPKISKNAAIYFISGKLLIRATMVTTIDSNTFELLDIFEKQ